MSSKVCYEYSGVLCSHLFHFVFSFSGGKNELLVAPQLIFKHKCFCLWSSSCFRKGSYFLGCERLDGLPYGFRAQLRGWCLTGSEIWELWWKWPWLLLIYMSCVFTTHRMNNGPVLGHEEEVGRRTTFRLFYPESVFSDPDHNDPNTTAILTAFKPLDLKWLWELLTGGKIVSWQNRSVFWFPSVFFKNIFKKDDKKLYFLYSYFISEP